MAYTPTTWVTGDTVTATKLNKLEQGVANANTGGALIVHATNSTLDKTVQELYDATLAGTPIYLSYTYGDWSLGYSENSLAYMFSIFKYNDNLYRMGFIRQGGFMADGQEDYLPVPVAAWFGATSMSSYPTYITGLSLANQN